MSILINDNFQVRSPKPIDDRWGLWDMGVWRPFNSVSEALSSIEPYRRYKSLTVPLVISGETKEYWFKEGVGDSNFVEKSVDLTNYYTKTELKTPGQSEINWNNLIDAPELYTKGQVDSLLAGKVNTSLSITNSYGVVIGGSLSTALTIGVDTDTLDSRYLRKDIDDGNGSKTLTIGTLVAETGRIESSLYLPSLSTGTSNDVLVLGLDGLVQKKTLSFDGEFGIANNAGTKQFDVALGSNLRFNGTGDTVVSFNPATQTITINSVPGQGGGGFVTSWNGRDGGVLPEAGDYTTTLVTEGENLYFTEGRTRGTVLTGLPTPTNTTILATDSILQAFGKLQGQVSSKGSASTTLTVNGTAGRVIVSGGTQDLTTNRAWTVDLQGGIVTSGTYPKVTVDSYGRVINGETLIESDIPSLNTSKITAGVFNTARLGTGTASGSTFLSGDGTWKSTPNTIYTGSNGINVSGTVISPNYGTAQNTIAQGNDSRINNGQTAYSWGNFRDYGLGKNVTVDEDDLNDYGETGFYRFNNTELNRPFSFGTLYHARRNPSEMTQLAIPVQPSAIGIAWRGQTSQSIWDWRTIWDNNNHVHRSDAQNDNRYILKAGDTMSGTLTVHTSTLINDAQVLFNRPNNPVYISADNPDNGGIILRARNSSNAWVNYLTMSDGNLISDVNVTFNPSSHVTIRGLGDRRMVLQSTRLIGGNYIEFRNNANVRTAFLGQGSSASNAMYYTIDDASDHIFSTNGIVRMRVTGTGAVEITSQLIAPTFTRTTQGLVPTPGGTGTTRYLREDGSWTVPAGGGTVTPTDLSLGTRNSTTLVINSSTGTNVTVPAVTTSLAGLMTAADKSKLNGLSSNAATATALQTARTIWGQSFNGTANVSGALSGATTITASSTIQSTGGDIIAYSSSDMRLKDFIKPFENPLGMIDKISGNTFVWNDNQDVHTGEDYGVIAQEVEAILPHAVTTRLNGYKAVRYEKLIPLLVEGIKALQKELNELKGGNNGIS